MNDKILAYNIVGGICFGNEPPGAGFYTLSYDAEALENVVWYTWTVDVHYLYNGLMADGHVDATGPGLCGQEVLLAE